MSRHHHDGIFIFIASVGKLLNDVIKLGHAPTLVGGMTLITLGSTRVTKDFDLLIAEEARDQANLIRIFYQHDFELVSAVDKNDNVTATIDKPKSAYFYNHTIGLRIELLFDFPMQAKEVHAKSEHKKFNPIHFISLANRTLFK